MVFGFPLRERSGHHSCSTRSNGTNSGPSNGLPKPGQLLTSLLQQLACRANTQIFYECLNFVLWLVSTWSLLFCPPLLNLLVAVKPLGDEREWCGHVFIVAIAIVDMGGQLCN